MTSNEIEADVHNSDDFIRGYQVAKLIDVPSYPLPMIGDGGDKAYSSQWESWADRTGHRKTIQLSPHDGFMASSYPLEVRDNGGILLEVELAGTVIEYDPDESAAPLLPGNDISGVLMYRGEWQRILRASIFTRACCYRTTRSASRLSLIATQVADLGIQRWHAHMWVCPEHEAILKTDADIQVVSLSQLGEAWQYEATYGGSVAVVTGKYWTLRKLHLDKLYSKAYAMEEPLKVATIVAITIQAAVALSWFISGVLPRNRPVSWRLWLANAYDKANFLFYAFLIAVGILEVLIIRSRRSQQVAYRTICRQALALSAAAIVVNSAITAVGQGIMMAHGNPHFLPPDLAEWVAVIFVCVAASFILVRNKATAAPYVFWMVFFALSAAFSGIALYT